MAPAHSELWEKKLRHLFKEWLPATSVQQNERSPRGAGGMHDRRGEGSESRMNRHGREQGAGRSDRKLCGVLLLPYVNETVLSKVKQVAHQSGLGVHKCSLTCTRYA